ncbi:MAG: cell division protein ZapA [Thiolinea sp.]
MSSNDNTIVPVTVQIFGREYPVACPAGEEHALLQSAKFVDHEMRKVRQNGKVVGTDRIAVMVSLNLAHELMLSRTGARNNTDNAVSSDDEGSQERIGKMHERIDSALQQYQLYLPE